MTPTSHFDVVILGAGAAGLMCAFEAGRRGRSVVVLDHADRAGKKILISGGGRCNFTNTDTRPENFLSNNPHFAKSALSRFTPEDMVALVEKHGIAYHEKKLGQLFCGRSAQEIVTLLERECADANVQILTGTTIDSVAQSEESRISVAQSEESRVSVAQSEDSRFTIATSRGTFSAESLIVATGGLSIPKMGATGLGYDIAAQFGLKIVDCRPGLVPLVFDPADLADWSDLSGLSSDVVVTDSAKKPRASFREKMLITHRGLSGPAILQISSFWNPGETVLLDLAPNLEIFAGLLDPGARRDAGAAFSALRSVLPARMAERWITLNQPERWTNAAIEALETRIHTWQIRPDGSEGYAKAEVTGGGVDTRELDARTMESRKVPGLYFIGEVVDVTGWLGGYNFQWAWASAVAAGTSA